MDQNKYWLRCFENPGALGPDTKMDNMPEDNMPDSGYQEAAYMTRQEGIKVQAEMPRGIAIVEPRSAARRWYEAFGKVT